MTTINESPESQEAQLADALSKFKELCDRCGFESGTVVSAPADMNVEHGLFGRTVGSDELLLEYSEHLSESQKRAVIIGIPKVYEAFGMLGFVDLSVYVKKRTGGMYNPRVGIYFDELSNPGRRFGTKVSLLNDSVEDIVRKLIDEISKSERKDGAVDKTQSGVRNEVDGTI